MSRNECRMKPIVLVHVIHQYINEILLQNKDDSSLKKLKTMLNG
jgi:hypothetical protein